MPKAESVDVDACGDAMLQGHVLYLHAMSGDDLVVPGIGARALYQVPVPLLFLHRSLLCKYIIIQICLLELSLD